MYIKSTTIALLVVISVTSSSIVKKTSGLFSNGISGIIVAPRNSPHAKVVDIKGTNQNKVKLKKLIYQVSTQTLPLGRQIGTTITTGVTVIKSTPPFLTTATTLTISTGSDVVNTSFESEILSLLQQFQSLGNTHTPSAELGLNHHHHYYAFQQGHNHFNYGAPKPIEPSYGIIGGSSEYGAQYNHPHHLNQHVHGIVLPPVFGSLGIHSHDYGEPNGYHGHHIVESHPHNPHYHIPNYPTQNPIPSISGIVVTQVVSGQNGVTTKTFIASATPIISGHTTYIFTSTWPVNEAVTTLIDGNNQVGTATTILVTTSQTTSTTTSAATTISGQVTLTQSGSTGSNTIVITSPITGRKKPVFGKKSEGKLSKEKNVKPRVQSLKIS